MSLRKLEKPKATQLVSAAEFKKIKSKKTVIVGISHGLIAAVIYSLVPLLLYILPANGGYGDLNSTLNTTFYVTIQEIMAAVVMFLFYKPTNFIRYFKKLRHKTAWLIILFGFLGGPFAMIFLQLAVLMTINAAGKVDGTVPNLLLNLNVILAAVGSIIFFRARQSKYTWIALILSTTLIIGMSINFAVEQGLSWSSIGGMCLALVTAGLYSLEALGMSHLMRSSKVKFTDKEAVSIKTGSSALIMLVFGLPIAALVDNPHQGFWVGYQIFSNFQYYQYLIIFLCGGVIMGTGRMLYYSGLSKAGPTYTTATQLLMFFWTPVFQYLFIAIGVPTEILPPTWYYWIYVIPIIFCTFLISINEYIIFATEVGWRKALSELFHKVEVVDSLHDEKAKDKLIDKTNKE
ncbi:hypothetical protein [Spiroplasma chrysopicola]|uniref:EamA domain-containing protein n=1 Tax=Spiroplasma chrysopicola DF-1 TaxID=1276227 RepID=R4UBW4_9MOLU|nr:hypothetical protein [Spiroplasma chrysopicola]AGM25414.1 hypothetical protein SCHRY_v1c08390 [Spiroplasma chrysopicola DF-1]